MSEKLVREERTTAVAVGLLYVLATAAGFAALFANAPSEVAAMASSRGSVLVTALLDMVMAIAVAGVAVMFYPVLVRDARTRGREGMAAWYLGSRITEGAVFVVGVLALIAMLAVSDAMASAPPVLVASYEAVAVALSALFQYSWVAGQTVFCVGAVMLYWLLFVSRRVPRWLSVWGLVAAPLMLAGGLLLPFTNDPNSAISSALYAPMGVQEMVLAVWLIGWGLRPSAAGSSASAVGGGS